MQQRRSGIVLDHVLLAFAAVIAALQFGLFPFLLHVSLATAVALVALAALTAPLHYGLMHETLHGKLFGSESTDRSVGRVLGILLGFPWETMRFGHLAHHSMNRHSLDRPEMLRYEQALLPAAAVYYFKLIIGHALSYALMPLAALLPVRTTVHVLRFLGDGPEVVRLRARALRTFTNIRRRNAVRFDLVVIFALFGTAVWMWGSAWPVFATCIGARWSVLSLLDNAPHYGMPLDSGLDARNTLLPKWGQWLMMNGNYHGIHHRAPQLGWHELPTAFIRSGAAAEGAWAAAVLRQFRGPIRLENT
jgi:fatty acid desaturase